MSHKTSLWLSRSIAFGTAPLGAPRLPSRIGVHSVWQREGEVMNGIAGRIVGPTLLLGRLAQSTSGRNFH